MLQGVEEKSPCFENCLFWLFVCLFKLTFVYYGFHFTSKIHRVFLILFYALPKLSCDTPFGLLKKKMMNVGQHATMRAALTSFSFYKYSIVL